jgi:hypothetical protein
MIGIRAPTFGWARERIPPFTNIFRHLTPNVRQIQKEASLAFRCRRFGRVTTVLLMSQVLFSARHENLPLEFLYVTTFRRRTGSESAFRKGIGANG